MKAAVPLQIVQQLLTSGKTLSDCGAEWNNVSGTGSTHKNLEISDAAMASLGQKLHKILLSYGCLDWCSICWKGRIHHLKANHEALLKQRVGTA